jgi:glycosyltransferase involved in cell wall biosynthesis
VTGCGPAATVVIRARDEAASVGPVLQQVVTQEALPDLEVIVIDSGSTDGTPEIVLRQARQCGPGRSVRLAPIPRETFTFGGALNLGARLARGPICVHLSAHCRPADAAWLVHLLAPFADADVVASVGRQLPVPGLNPFEAVDLERMFPADGRSTGGPRPFSNANCAVRRDFLRAHPFDETIPIMEDALWALDRGPGERVVYVPEATVFHSHPLRLRYWRARYYQHGLAHRYIRARRGIDLLPERSRGPVGRLGHHLAEARRLGPALARQGRWWHLAAYPVFAAARELALRRGLREGRALFGDQDRRPTSPSSP